MRELLSSSSSSSSPAAALRGFWEDVNESPAWQDGAFFSLSAAYALVSAVALIQLIRIQRRVPEFGWTTQKVFHLMNFIVNGVRAVVFGFHVHVFLLPTKVYKLVLLDLPGLLFFSTYILLVLFWAEIYHQVLANATHVFNIPFSYFLRIFIQWMIWVTLRDLARSLPTDKLRIIYVAVNSVIYVIQVCIWVYLGINDNSLVELVSKIFIVVVSFVALLGFSVYGGRLFFLLRRFPIESKGRQKKLYEVGTVTAICCVCFLIRCIVVALSAFDPDVSLEVLDHPILDLFYYMLTEILPSALVLFILRKLPPKRVSAQYHPIN
uniref:THH1/TOM1/TOM3 domain-containing protein n=1 Tax=Leersia perrieri TaxID=77586 RepID=A0A0D9WUJ9_9ORYZ